MQPSQHKFIKRSPIALKTTKLCTLALTNKSNFCCFYLKLSVLTILTTSFQSYCYQKDERVKPRILVEKSSSPSTPHPKDSIPQLKILVFLAGYAMAITTLLSSPVTPLLLFLTFLFSSLPRSQVIKESNPKHVYVIQSETALRMESFLDYNYSSNNPATHKL
jgi:hypothetical protein